MGFTKDPEQLNKVLFKRTDSIVGGVDVLFIGKPGCGKTTGLARFALTNKKLYKDVIVWRGSADCQWSYFLNSKEKMVLWLKEGLDLKLINRKTEKEVKFEDYFIKINRWKTAEELVRRLDKKYINVVETVPFTPVSPRQHIMFCRDWCDILFKLTTRVWNDPVSIFFDELEDLVPEAQGSDFWDVELSISSIIRSLRKNDISSYMACHTLEDVHWRIKKKIRWKIYMYGSKPDSGSRLTVNMNKLSPGEGWIEGDQIEKFSFNCMGNEHNLRYILMNPEDVLKTRPGSLSVRRPAAGSPGG